MTDEHVRTEPAASSAASDELVQQALLMQFHQLSVIFDSLDVIVYVADLQTYELLFMNGYARRIFGEDFPGKRCYEVLQHGQHGRCPFCTNGRLVRDGVPQEPYVWEFQNTVTGRWFMCIDQAIRWVDGRLVRMEVAIDISERKQAESEREELLGNIQRQAAMLEATLNSMADGIVICDPAGRIVRMNDVAKRLLAYSPEEERLPVRERLALLHLQTPAGRPLSLDQAPLICAIERGVTMQGVVACREHKDGSMTWMSMSATPIIDSDGQTRGAISTLTDITALHQLEEQREDYLHMISHDLRNPLTPIIGTSGWLQKRLAERGLDDEAEGAELISESAWRIQAMTEDLVESARMESGNLELDREPAVACQMVHRIVSHFGTSEQRDRLRLHCPENLPLVDVDSERVERVIANLLNNAFKYSPPDTPVALRVEHEDDGHVSVAITNEGAGIPGDELPHLFERYYRARSGKKTEGLGLGLYIARKIVEAHGGRIQVVSDAGRTTFSFTLPLASEVPAGE